MSVIVNGVKYTQISNGHVMGVTGGRMVFHAQYNRMMTEAELREYAEEVEELRNGHLDCTKAVDRPHS